MKKQLIPIYVLVFLGLLIAVASMVFTVYHAYTAWKNSQTIKDIDTCCAMCEEPFEYPNFERDTEHFFYRTWKRMNDLESAFRTKYPQLPLRLIAETEKLRAECSALAYFVFSMHECRNPNLECVGTEAYTSRYRDRFKLLMNEHDCCKLPPQPDPWDCDFKCY